jgi:hypothetical protein
MEKGPDEDGGVSDKKHQVCGAGSRGGTWREAPAPKDQPLSVRPTGVAPSGRRVPTAPLHGLDASFVGFWRIMALFENLGMPEPDV